MGLSLKTQSRIIIASLLLVSGFVAYGAITTYFLKTHPVSIEVVPNDYEIELYSNPGLTDILGTLTFGPIVEGAYDNSTVYSDVFYINAVNETTLVVLNWGTDAPEEIDLILEFSNNGGSTWTEWNDEDRSLSNIRMHRLGLLSIGSTANGTVEFNLKLYAGKQN